MKMTIGGRLPNGAILLAFVPIHPQVEESPQAMIIGKFEHSSSHPFVTWRIDGAGETYWGKYFRTYPEAILSFKERITT